MLLLLVFFVTNLVNIVLCTIGRCKQLDDFGDITDKMKRIDKMVGTFSIKKPKLDKRTMEHVNNKMVESFYPVAEETLRLLERFPIPEDVKLGCQNAISICIDSFNEDLEEYMRWWKLRYNDRITEKTFSKMVATIELDMAKIKWCVGQLQTAIEGKIAEKVRDGSLLNARKGESLERYMDILGEERNNEEDSDKGTEGESGSETGAENF